MKKKQVLTMTLMISLMFLSGCVSAAGELPYGVWESEEPHILLDIPYDSDGWYHGKYEKDGEMVDIVIGFAVSHKSLEIYDAIVQKDNVLAE